MYEVELLNRETGSTFTRKFDSPYLMNKFLNKCKYSKKVKVLSVTKWY